MALLQLVEQALIYHITVGSHLVSFVVFVCFVGWAQLKFGPQGLIVPAFLFVYSESQFNFLVSVAYGSQYFTDVIGTLALPIVLVVYFLWFRLPVPWLFLGCASVFMALFFVDGSRVSYGFISDPMLYYHNFEVNGREILGWVACSLAFVLDMQGVKKIDLKVNILRRKVPA